MVSEIRYDAGRIELPAGFLANPLPESSACSASTRLCGSLPTRRRFMTGGEPTGNYVCRTFLGDKAFTEKRGARIATL